MDLTVVPSAKSANTDAAKTAQPKNLTKPEAIVKLLVITANTGAALTEILLKKQKLILVSHVITAIMDAVMMIKL